MGKLSVRQLQGLIHLIRGKRVMLDSDLARMYGVSTGALNQAVRRNRTRFPPDFMFKLNQQETKNWKSQIGDGRIYSVDKFGLQLMFDDALVSAVAQIIKEPGLVAALCR